MEILGTATIFGIPVVVIIIVLIWAVSSCVDEQEKKNKQIARQWDAITVGMTVEDVFKRLGKPNRVVKMGVQEAWGYGPSDSDGAIMFLEGRVVGYQKPSCTVNVSAGQPAAADTADVSDGRSPETDTAHTTCGQSTKRLS